MGSDQKPLLRRILKVVGVLAVLFVFAVAGVLGWFSMQWIPEYPETAYPEVQASDDPEVIAQGEYLFHAVTHCTICHTPAEDFLARENVYGMEPVGGHEWEMGPLGTMRSANVSLRAQDYSDEELGRLLQTGIGRDHKPVPLMIAIGPMDDRDLTALISYIRTLDPQGDDVPPSEFGLMGKVLLQTMMAGFVKPKYTTHELTWAPPAEEPSVERGAYLSRGPGYCFGCHSEAKIAPELEIVEPMFAGNPRPDPDPQDETMEISAPNLTSHATGMLSRMSEDGFVARFKEGGRAVEHSPMPWENYRNMTENDLRSIYRYLASVPPVDRDTGPSYRPVGWSPG